MAIEIRIDRGACMSAGECLYHAPGAFTHDEHDIAVVTDPDGEPEERLRKAVRGCPNFAISLWRDGEQLA